MPCPQARRSISGAEMRFTHAVEKAVVAAIILLSGCARYDGTELMGRYPHAAQRILAGPGFTSSGGGYTPVEPAETDPLKAAEASLVRQGGLRLRLPERGVEAAKMIIQDGLVVEVR